MEENYLSKTFLFLSLVIIGLLAISLVPTHVWRNLQLKQVDLLGDIKVTIDPKEQTAKADSVPIALTKKTYYPKEQLHTPQRANTNRGL